MLRTNAKKARFGRRFSLDEAGEVLRPDSHDAAIDEALLDGVAVPVLQRVLTLLRLRSKASQPGVPRTLTVDRDPLDAPRWRDRSPNAIDSDANCGSETLQELTAQRQAETDRRAVERGENEGMTVHPE